MSQHNVPTRVLPQPEGPDGHGTDRRNQDMRTAPLRGAEHIRDSTTAQIHDTVELVTAPDAILDPLLAWEKTGSDPRSGPVFPIGKRSYRLTKKLGEGGLGAVYLAHPEGQPAEQVAVKIITVHGGNGEQAIMQMLNGAEREGNILRQRGQLFDSTSVEVPGAVRGEQREVGKKHYLHAMTYHNGLSLQDWMDISPNGLPPKDVCRIVLQLATELQEMAADQVLHHDIKASNIIVTTNGMRTHFVDYGAAKFIEQNIEQDPDSPHGIEQYTLNAASPEQILHHEGSMQSQVYCLGLLLLRMLGGQNGDPYAAIGIDAHGKNAREDITALHLTGNFAEELLQARKIGRSTTYLEDVTQGFDEKSRKKFRGAIPRMLAPDPAERMTIEEFSTFLEELMETLK